MTGGSRSIAVTGAAVQGVADKIVAKGKLVAASALEASAGDSEAHIASSRSMACGSGAIWAGSGGNGSSLEMAQT